MVILPYMPTEEIFLYETKVRWGNSTYNKLEMGMANYNPVESSKNILIVDRTTIGMTWYFYWKLC